MKSKNYYVDLTKNSDIENLIDLLSSLDYLELNYSLISHYQMDYLTKKPKPFIDAPISVLGDIDRLKIYDSPSRLLPSSLKYICNNLVIKVNIENLGDSDLLSLNNFMESFIKERFS